MATNFELSPSSSSLSEQSSGDEDHLADFIGLRKVDLSFHDLDDRDLERQLAEMLDEDDPDLDLEDGVRVNISVVRLYLYNNQLRIPPSSAFKRFPALTVLDLSNNAVRKIPQEMAELTGLTQLFLRNNLLRNEDDFPKTLAALTNLRDLNISGNRLESIPRQILELPHLRNLFLGGNRLAELPGGIGRLKRLRVLYLGGNR